MWKSHPLSAVLALASMLAVRSALLLIAASAPLLPGISAQAQPLFAKGGGGTFTNVSTPLLLNDAAGVFQTQGSVLCQAAQSGQLTSPSGVCMQYTPSVPFIGGAAATFGLKGGVSDYVSPPLKMTADAPLGSSSITVLNHSSTSNISFTSAIGPIQTLSALTASVSGALPAGETIASTVIGTLTTVLRLSSPTIADLPPGSTVTFTTNTSAQQFTGIASSVDLTAHQAPGTGGQAWGGNFIVEAEAGSNGLIHGIEIDVANFSTNIGGYGVWLGNNGSQNMNTGFFVGGGVGGKGWLYGLQSVSAVNDDILSVSSATTFNDDRGTHSIGSIYQGNYSTAILQAINPKALTPTTQALFTITPKGGMVDSSPVPVAATSGTSMSATQGSTGMILVCSGTLATLTIAMPPNALPKQPFHVASECTVNALTLTTGPGLTVLGAASSLMPSTPMTFVYDNDRGIWLRW